MNSQFEKGKDPHTRKKGNADRGKRAINLLCPKGAEQSLSERLRSLLPHYRGNGKERKSSSMEEGKENALLSGLFEKKKKYAHLLF